LVTAQLFNQDTDPKKVNLGIGAYRTEKGVPWVLPSIKAAEMIIAQDPKAIKEYLAIDGLPELKKAAQELVFSKATLSSGRVASCQALSGTGALRVAGEFLNCQLGVKKLYHSDPTWGNHTAIFNKCNMQVGTYPYYHEATRGFDFDGMMAAIEKMEEGSMILLHAVAHNPTGVDLTKGQWNEVLDVVKTKNLMATFDSAYQGFASGDLEEDSYSLKLFAENHENLVLFQSFAKNFGIYGERAGCLSVVCGNEEEKSIVMSRLKQIARPIYSNPPIHGARIVDIILSDPKLTAMWHQDLKDMSSRMKEMREGLKAKLASLGNEHSWEHVTSQIGMFAYTGLNTDMVNELREKYAVYMTMDGRISIAGLNSGNLDYVANAFHAVTHGKTF